MPSTWIQIQSTSLLIACQSISICLYKTILFTTLRFWATRFHDGHQYTFRINMIWIDILVWTQSDADFIRLLRAPISHVELSVGYARIKNKKIIKIRAVEGQPSSPESRFASKTKIVFRVSNKRRQITGPWYTGHCDLNLFWGQRSYYTDSFSKSMTFIHQLLFKT